jgi:N-acetylglucosamine kinase
MLPAAPAYFYGIAVTPERIELAACDARASVQLRRMAATPATDFRRFLATLAALVEQADAELDCRAPVGLAIPGIAAAQDGTAVSISIPCLGKRALAAALGARLDRPVTAGSDSQCFALGEANGGAAQGYPSMLGVLLGSGIGAARVVNGHLPAGRHGAASEWGHWPMPPALLRKHGLPLLPCCCGGIACMECYVSAMGLRNLHVHLTGAAGPSPAELAERSARGEPAACQVLALHLDLLGAALARLVLAYDPHAIVLGGALARLPRLHSRLAQAAAPHLLRGFGMPPIMAPEFGTAGVARGAALLAAQPYLLSCMEPS